MLNVEEIYQGIEELHGYKDNGKIYTFYYDETNNYRKVRITNNELNDFNVLMNNFTLGVEQCFEQCISHNKINIILGWILENEYIHYSDVETDAQLHI